MHTTGANSPQPRLLLVPSTQKRGTEIDNEAQRRDISLSYLQHCGASDAVNPLSLAFRLAIFLFRGRVCAPLCGVWGEGLNQFQIIAALNK